jgi:hypothetical protein
MDKQLFDDAIGEVPPSTVDVDAVIVRGRRAVRVRRVVNPAVAAGVAVVVLTGAIAFTVMRGDEGDGVRVGESPTSTTAPMPTTSSAGPLPEACQRTDLESADEVVARLTPLVKTKVQVLRPDLQLTAAPDEEQGPLEFLQEADERTVGNVPICDRTSSFRAFASTEGPEGVGSILIVVKPADRDDPGDCGAGQTFCEKGAGPNGDRLRQKTTMQDGATYTQVDVIRLDGTDIHLSSGGPITSGPPLTHEQLLAIGTDPGMTLFP